MSKSPRVTIITDTHWGARNDSLNFIEFYEKFYKDTFFPILEKNNINTLLMLGDTFDRRKYTNHVTLYHAKKIFFDILAEKNIETHILVGNHDIPYKNTLEANCDELFLNDYTNIHIIDKPTEIKIYDTNICMMPWICAENYDESMNLLENTSAELCMGHFEIDGFIMHPGAVSEGGLPRNMFKKFTKVFSGHYHHRSNKDNIYYLGNPYELTWSDYNDPRGFHLFDTTSYDLEFIENPNKMFYRVIYDDKTETLKDLSTKDMSLYSNKYVKLVVMNKTNPYLFDKFITNLYNVNPIDVTIVEDVVDIDSLDDNVDEAQDTLTILNTFVDGLKEDQIDTDKLKLLMKELYIEALNTQTA